MCPQHASFTKYILGDVSLSAEDKPPDGPSKAVPNTQVPAIPQPLLPVQSTYVEHEEEQEDDDDAFDDSHGWLEGHTALKFLLAGGVAGAGALSFIYCLCM